MDLRIKFLIGSLFWLALFSAVASDTIREESEDNEYKYSKDNRCNEVYDPYEKLNRKIFIFYLTLDRLLLKPLALGYNTVTNDNICSIFENVSMPLTTVNHAFQMRN